jgi:hypothetical protein
VPMIFGYYKGGRRSQYDLCKERGEANVISAADRRGCKERIKQPISSRVLSYRDRQAIFAFVPPE